MLDPDVVLSDYALSLLSFYFFSQLMRAQKKIEGLFFLFSGISTFLGGTYHGFFPLKTETVLGKTFWISTLSFLALAANQLWFYLLKITGRNLKYQRNFLGLAALLFIGHALFRDHRFLWGILYYSLPLFLLGIVLFWGVLRKSQTENLLGLGAIFSLMMASVLQQKGIGIHSQYFDHNALYHLISFGSLILFYGFFRRGQTC